ncbi:LOB domain-containing protein 36-like protein [Tanacetum coccineum]
MHKVFGASNVAKILNELSTFHREDAVNSLAYEADARLGDPVYGCVGLISVIQHRLKQVQVDLHSVKQDLATYMGPSWNNRTGCAFKYASNTRLKGSREAQQQQHLYEAQQQQLVDAAREQEMFTNFELQQLQQQQQDTKINRPASSTHTLLTTTISIIYALVDAFAAVVVLLVTVAELVIGPRVVML